MCQLSNSPDLLGDGEEALRLSRPEGELGGEEDGDGLFEAGGEGGSVGRSLWMGLIWWIWGRVGAEESSLLVNGCYHASYMDG